MKKAQIQGQVFIYILTLIITAGILLYGYNAIKVINENANRVELINFKDALKQDFEKMSSDYGSSDKFNYNVPSKIKKICFYQYEDNEAIYPSENINIDNPYIRDSIKDTDNNVFLVGDSTDSMKLARIEISEGQILCINISSNRLKLKLKGLGDGVSVEQA